jgi:hypothetical protein
MAKKAPKNNLEIRFILNKIVEVIGRVLLAIIHFIGRVFFFLLELFKSIWLGLSVFIISIALLISSLSLAFWVMTSTLNLEESAIYQEYRDSSLSELFDHWEAKKIKNQQYQAARKEKVKITEITDNICQDSSECKTPSEYLIQSNCAYESRCFENQCVIVCPKN